MDRGGLADDMLGKDDVSFANPLSFEEESTGEVVGKPAKPAKHAKHGAVAAKAGAEAVLRDDGTLEVVTDLSADDIEALRVKSGQIIRAKEVKSLAELNIFGSTAEVRAGGRGATAAAAQWGMQGGRSRGEERRANPRAASIQCSQRCL